MNDLFPLIHDNILWVQAALIIVLAILVLIVWLRYRSNQKLLQYYSTLMESYEEGNLESILRQLAAKYDETSLQLAALQGRVAACEARLPEHLDRFALLRYKAFPDVGGDLSFSLALLNQKGSGLILTGIHGRSETRIYAKGIEGFKSNHPLSDEEQQVLEAARNNGGSGDQR